MATHIDETVLQDMSVALSQGRRVTFKPGGDPSASLDTQDAMQQSASEFLGTKIDEINALLDKGLEVNVDPDGSLYTFSPDRASRYISDANPDIEMMERYVVHEGIRQGATVVIEPDGSIGYHVSPGTTPPAEAQAALRIKAFDEQLDSGKLTEAAQQGKQFELSSQGSMSFVTDDASGISGVGDPAPCPRRGLPAALPPSQTRQRCVSRPLKPPRCAARIREVTHDHFTETYSGLAIGRDERAARRVGPRSRGELGRHAGQAGAAPRRGVGEGGQGQRSGARPERRHRHLPRGLRECPRDGRGGAGTARPCDAASGRTAPAGRGGQRRRDSLAR